ncbi:hypothetical protein [Escherichia coli]|uniref:hypothetical protein n=1 Tax=Escherichia coli TaxID=562 RepID=UPI001BFF7263|nr:hypothetical protein [Escherichia coli]
MRLTAKQVIWLKVCLHLAGLLPFLWLVWAINHGGLGADPVKDIQHFTGRTALKFLLAALLITPLARYAKQPVYLVAILTPIHYLWSVKIISPQPLIYAGLAVLLLALRYKKLLSLFNRLRKQAHNKLSL